MKNYYSKIDVIIPYYNMSYCVKDAIDSIPKDEEVKITIVDDRSSHEEYKFIKDLETEESVNVIPSVKNRGAGVARQIGVDNTSGEWIMFLDADDKILPLKDGNNVFSIILKDEVPDDVNIIRYKVLWTSDSNEKVDLGQTDYLIHGMIFRRQFLKDTGIQFHPDLRLFEDMYFSKVALYKAKGHILDVCEQGYFMSNNPRSTTKSLTENKDSSWLNEHVDDHLKMVRSILLDLTNKEIEENEKDLLDIFNWYDSYEPNDEEIKEIDRLKRYIDFSNTTEAGSTNKKLSIIIPCYQKGTTEKDNIIYLNMIGETMRKLYRRISQFMDDIEVICCVDGYTHEKSDLTEVLSYYENMTVLPGVTRRFMGGNRNRGLRYANAEYIVFLDHDDELTHDGIRYIIENYGRCYDILRFNTIISSDDTERSIGLCTWAIHSEVYRYWFLRNFEILFNERYATSEDVYFQHRCNTLIKKAFVNVDSNPDMTLGIWTQNKNSTYTKLYNSREYDEEFLYETICQTIDSCKYTPETTPSVDEGSFDFYYNIDSLEEYMRSSYPAWIQRVCDWERTSANFNAKNIAVMMWLDIFCNVVLKKDYENKELVNNHIYKAIKEAKYYITDVDMLKDILNKLP